jgi:putative ABC transport system permease protein
MRSLLSFLLIGVPVTLILALVGLTQGMQQDSERRARGTGADIIVRGTNAASAVSFSAASLLEKMQDFLEGQPHVRMAMGVVEHPIELPLRVTGIDIGRLNQMSGGIRYLEGGPFQGPKDMVVDKYYATQRHIHAGDPINVMNTSWRVSGVIEGGLLSHILVPLKTLQDLDASTGKLSQVYLKLDDPGNADAVKQYLKQKLGPEYPVWTMQDLESMLSINNIQGVKEFTIVVVAIGVVIGFAVVCLSMYMAVLQRTREIGILKSMGGSNGFILRIILIEAVILGVGGTMLGILMSFGAYWLIHTLVPASIPMVIVPAWWPIAGIITLIGALGGALYPGLSAARHDPIEALAYE